MRLGPAELRFTGRVEGDVGSAAERGPHGPSETCLARRAAVVDRPWTWLRQVHGGRVVTVLEPGGSAGEEADAAVTATAGTALAILTADCAPVAMVSPEGIVGAAHAGWRGLVAGVIEETAAAMRRLGASSIDAALGPCIHPECYEFSESDLAVVVDRFGTTVRGRTADGKAALDVPAAVKAACALADVRLADHVDECTVCTAEAYYSHRARADDERQALVIWIP